jgi:hypothetical protein
MARKPYKYTIKLPETERQELGALISRGKTERRLADRARMILWTAKEVTKMCYNNIL